MSAAASAETLWIRERVSEMLQAGGFHLVVESVSRGDGWRGEFLQTSDDEDEDLVLTTHKPDDAPYVSLGVFVAYEPPQRVSDWSALTDCVSDFEASFYFRDDTPACVITSRVFLDALDHDAFEFQLGNLVACRGAVRELIDAEYDVDASVQDTESNGSAGS